MNLFQALGLFYFSFLLLVAVFFLTERQSLFESSSYHGGGVAEGKNKLTVEKVDGETGLSIDELVGQVIFLAPQGRELSKEERTLFQKRFVGGAFLVERNVEDQAQMERLVSQLTTLGVVVAVDQEGGRVSRLPWVEATPQREIVTEVEALSVAETRGKQLRQLGIRMNLAPVVEKISDGQSYIARTDRAFVADNGRMAAAMVKGYLEAGIIPVAKHFPGGLGRAGEDPHLTLPIVPINQQQLEEDLQPFRAVVAAQVPAIMITHILYPELDEMPASASQIFMDDVLRGRLGFKGLVVVDDLSMAAVKDNYEVGEYAVKSLKAGADMLLVSEFGDYEKVVVAVIQATEHGELGRDRLLEAYAKVGKLLR